MFQLVVAAVSVAVVAFLAAGSFSRVAMFQLTVAFTAVATTAFLALTSIYYGGQAFSERQARAQELQDRVVEQERRFEALRDGIPSFAPDGAAVEWSTTATIR